jgi:hypothetical protein
LSLNPVSYDSSTAGRKLSSTTQFQPSPDGWLPHALTSRRQPVLTECTSTESSHCPTRQNGKAVPTNISAKFQNRVWQERPGAVAVTGSTRSLQVPPWPIRATFQKNSGSNSDFLRFADVPVDWKMLMLEAQKRFGFDASPARLLQRWACLSAYHVYPSQLNSIAVVQRLFPALSEASHPLLSLSASALAAPQDDCDRGLGHRP